MSQQDRTYFGLGSAVVHIESTAYVFNKVTSVSLNHTKEQALTMNSQGLPTGIYNPKDNPIAIAITAEDVGADFLGESFGMDVTTTPANASKSSVILGNNVPSGVRMLFQAADLATAAPAGTYVVSIVSNVYTAINATTLETVALDTLLTAGVPTFSTPDNQFTLVIEPPNAGRVRSVYGADCEADYNKNCNVFLAMADAKNTSTTRNISIPKCRCNVIPLSQEGGGAASSHELTFTPVLGTSPDGDRFVYDIWETTVAS